MNEFHSTTHPDQAEIHHRVSQALPNLPSRCKRILCLLQVECKASTAMIAHTCSVGNVSDACLAMQETLKAHGLFIRNFAPEPALQNQFGERSQMHFWELVAYEKDLLHPA